MKLEDLKICIESELEDIYALNQSLTPELGALKDIPWINQKNKRLILVNNSEDVINGLETLVKKEYKDSIFIHDHVKLDQAFGCLLAREFLQNNKELFIGACDNGFDLDIKKFNKLKKISDVIVFTHTGDINIQNNPNAHSWLKLKSDNLSVKNISLKKIISSLLCFNF